MECSHSLEKMCIQLVPIFNHLEEKYLAQIMELSQTKHYKKNETIYAAGELADNLFIVHKGKVKLYAIDESGKEHIFNILNSGDYIGETSLFLSSDHINYAEAIEDTTICTIYKEDLMELLEDHPVIAIKILEEFSKRLTDSQTQATRVIAKSTDSRLALYLIENCDEKDLVNLNISRKDLANYLGMTPETVSRRFKQFEDEGLIKQVSSKTIKILDYDKLEAK